MTDASAYDSFECHARSSLDRTQARAQPGAVGSAPSGAIALDSGQLVMG